MMDSLSHRAWLANCQLPGPRTAKAMRLLVGLPPLRAAIAAGVSLDDLRAFEANALPIVHWRPVSRRLNAAYAEQGARWCEPDLHEGAFCVYLESGAASDRQVIAAALALLRYCERNRRQHMTARALAARVQLREGIPAAKVQRALTGRHDAMTPLIMGACLRQLGTGPAGAGCYFVKADPAGWRGVGCGIGGARW